MRKNILLLLLLSCMHLHGQHAVVGLGYIECLNAGAKYPVTKKFMGITTVGFNLLNQNQTYDITQKFGMPILKKKLENRKTQLGMLLNLSSWYFNNQWNTFINVSVGPELQIERYFSKLGIIFYGGVLRNNVVYYKRKTNLEVGWPHNWQPSVGMRLCFNSNKE